LLGTPGGIDEGCGAGLMPDFTMGAFRCQENYVDWSVTIRTAAGTARIFPQRSRRGCDRELAREFQEAGERLDLGEWGAYRQRNWPEPRARATFSRLPVEN
jgi:hypothetical protein